MWQHVIWECYGCDKKKLQNKNYILKFINSIIKILRVKKIKINGKNLEPTAVKFDWTKDKSKWGITGFIIIAESHICVHTWPEFKYAGVDVFSCKKFDQEEIGIFIKKKLNANHIEHKQIIRGKYIG